MALPEEGGIHAPPGPPTLEGEMAALDALAALGRWPAEEHERLRGELRKRFGHPDGD